MWRCSRIAVSKTLPAVSFLGCSPPGLAIALAVLDVGPPMNAFDRLAIKTARRIVAAEEKRNGSQEPSTLATARQILAAIKALISDHKNRILDPAAANTFLGGRNPAAAQVSGAPPRIT